MKVKRRQLVTTIYPVQLFSTAILPADTRFLKWETADGSDLDDILFDVMEDKSLDMDNLICICFLFSPTQKNATLLLDSFLANANPSLF
ncbi:hypothetical protein PDN41_25700 [Bacillus cereus]|nr:hypothetical protein [Bacillus cereus]